MEAGGALASAVPAVVGGVARRRGRRGRGAGLRDGLALAGFAASAWLIGGAFAELIERIRLFRVPFAAAPRVAAQPLSVWGSAIAHAGMGVTVAGIAGMSLAASTIIAVTPGETVSLAGYDWTLPGLHDARGPNYMARVADLRVTRDGRDVVLFHPSRRVFTEQQTTVTDTAIQTNGFRDLYAVLGDERDGSVVLRLHVNRLAPWIWFGALVMAIGGGLSLADRRLRIGAPARRAAAVPAGVELRMAPSPTLPRFAGEGILGSLHRFAGEEVLDSLSREAGEGRGGGNPS